MQFVNSVSFVIPNIYLIAVPCSWEAPIIGALSSFPCKILACPAD